MLTATLYYNAITKDYSKTLAATAAEPAVTQQTKYFLANIGNVKTVNDLVNNSKLYTYVMTAFGLSDMMNAKGLIRQVLEGGVSNPKSLANTLNDPRYKALASAFNFAANGAEHNKLDHAPANHGQQLCRADARNQCRPAKPRHSNGAVFSAHGSQYHERLQHPRR